LYHQQWIRPIEAAAIARADQVTTVSRYAATQAANTFKRNDIKSVYNWNNAQSFHPITRQRPAQPFRLLFVGKIGTLKGADLLPAIMRRLGDEFTLHYTGKEQDFGGRTRLPPNMLPLGRLVRGKNARDSVSEIRCVAFSNPK
jgi:glycosyltransferase involved in cell wall biosynthesis